MRFSRVGWGSGLAVMGFAALAAAQRAPAALPSFDRVQLLETTSETSANVSIGDLDRDGHLDLVLAKGRHWPLPNRVLFGDGTGRFSDAVDLGEVSNRTYSGRLSDLDRDGDLDIVVSNDRPDPKLVYLNDGEGRFELGSTFGSPEWRTRNAAVADLNGDGQPDIVAANRTGNRPGGNYICLNRGKGKFDSDCIAFSAESATTISPADFNRDGLVDLIVPNRDGGQSYIYVNAPDAELDQLRRVAFGPDDATIRMAEAGELDGDRRLDIVTIDQRIGVAIFFQRDGESFTDAVPLGEGGAVPYAMALADLDRDGSLDILVGHVEAASTAYFNDGSGESFTPVRFGDDAGTAYGFAVDDLDGDGQPDIAVARSGAPNAVYFGAPASR